MSKLNAEEDFLVKESKGVNLVIGLFTIIMFLAFISSGDYDWPFCLMFSLLLIPGILALQRAGRNSAIIKINKTGFYHNEKFVCLWQQFYGAQVFEEEYTPRRINDSFILKFRYYSLDYSLIYTLSIPLTNTQDKAEEEIIEAISFYYHLDRAKPTEKISHTV